MPEKAIDPLSNTRPIGRLTITYTIEADGSTSTTYDSDTDLPLITQLGLLRLAEDTAIRTAMENTDDA